MSEAVEPEVLVERTGRLGHLVLNRPKAINALTHGMVLTLLRTLRDWAGDDEIQTVLLTGSGERGLCAGGDIVSLYQDAKSGDTAASARFWFDEYQLNALIANYPKPYVVIQDGIVLGGGIGVSAHGSHRIVTERSRLGLPEAGIGFVPDIGSTRLLSHAPGQLGTHLALTAGMVDAGDAIAVGLADSFVPSERLPQLIEALQGTDPDAAIAAVAEPAPASGLASQREWIDSAYAAGTVAEIVAALQAGPEPAQRAAEAILRTSPTASAVTLESLRRAATLGSLEQTLNQEYRVSLRALAAPDFAEGVRAQVIDKDRNPRWNPATLAEVTAEQVAAFFAPLPDDAELPFAP